MSQREGKKRVVQLSKNYAAKFPWQLSSFKPDSVADIAKRRNLENLGSEGMEILRRSKSSKLF